MTKFMLTTALSTVLSTAMLSGLALGAYAQTTTTEAPASPMPDFVAPDGYARFEDRAALSVVDLQGATIYDATGETVGEISDLVLTTSGAGATMPTDSTTGRVTDTTTGATASTMTDSATTTSDPATVTATVGTTADPVIAPNSDTATGTTATDGSGTDTATAPATETDEQASGSGTDTAATGMADGTNTGGTADVATNPTIAETATDKDPSDGNMIETDATGTVATPGTGTTAAADAGETAETEVALAGSQITNVVVDTGGFLGMGVHTVALPISALEIYVDGSNNYRIYLPWTEDQLRTLPAYDENDPATLG